MQPHVVLHESVQRDGGSVRELYTNTGESFDETERRTFNVTVRRPASPELHISCEEDRSCVQKTPAVSV